MTITNVKIDELKSYKGNAKKHDKKQISNVAESIKQFGFVQPIVVDANNEIVIGHCRYEAARKLKMQEVPCVSVDTLTPEQVQKLRLLDNKLNESEWDFDLLAEQIPELDFSGFDVDWGIENEDEYGTDFSLPDGGKSEICTMTFTLHEQQKELIEYAMACVEDEITETFGNANKNGNALYEVIRQWAAQKT
jgi:hypothetical protein